MALRGPTRKRQGYNVPTAPVKEEVAVVETPKKKKKPTKKSGFFSPSKK